MTTHLYWHPDIFLHDQAANHVAMDASRIAHIHRVVSAVPGLTPVLAQAATREQFLLAHSAPFVDRLFTVAPTAAGQRYAFDRETVMNEHTLRTQLLSVGAACQAVEAVVTGAARNAFCSGYAGHHATPDTAMGFCFTNAVAIAGKHALAQGVQRLAILDMDTHSGNGTVLAFWAPDARVLFAETHQAGYPGAFMRDTRPAHILRRKVTRAVDFLPSWDKLLAPVRDFAPELILVSAGFDAHQDDPLSRMGLSDAHYVHLAQKMLAISPHVVAVLEGGYNLDSASRCAALFVEQLVQG